MTNPLERALTTHATVVVIRETGVLIRGASGAGKSRLALALIAAGERRGWFACLVGDDQVTLHLTGSGLIARPHLAIAGLIEQRGVGLLSAKYEPAARLACIIDLTGSEPPRLPGGSVKAAIAGLSLPCLTLPSGLGPDEGVRRILHFLNRELG